MQGWSIPGFQVSNVPTIPRDMSNRQVSQTAFVDPVAEDLAIRAADTSPQQEPAVERKSGDLPASFRQAGSTETFYISVTVFWSKWGNYIADIG